MQQAPPAILLAALRRFRGPAVFLGLRPCPRQGAPFWPSGLTLRSSGPAFCGPLTLAVRTTNKKPKQETYMRRNILIYTIIAALFLIAYSFNRVQNNNICAQQQTNYLNDIAKPFIEKNQEKYRLWQSTIGKSHQSDYPRTWLGASHQFSFTIQQYRSLELLPSNIIDDIIMKIELESKKWKSCP